MKTFVFTCAAALLAAGCSSEDEISSKLRDHPANALVGEAFPEFDVAELPSMQSAGVTFDKPTVVNVWATWCPPCVKELPSLSALGKRDDFDVITISTDKQPELVQSFLQDNGLEELDVRLDPMGRRTREHLKAQGLPVSYLVGADGKIYRVDAGERDWHHPKTIELLKKTLPEGESS